MRYRGSLLGLAWSYVKPAVQFVVYFFAIGRLPAARTRRSEDFAGLPVLRDGRHQLLQRGASATPPARSSATRRWSRRSICRASCSRSPRCGWRASTSCRSWSSCSVGALIAGWRAGPVRLLGAVARASPSSPCSRSGSGCSFGALNVLFRDFENIVDLIADGRHVDLAVLYPGRGAGRRRRGLRLLSSTCQPADRRGGAVPLVLLVPRRRRGSGPAHRAAAGPALARRDRRSSSPRPCWSPARSSSGGSRAASPRSCERRAVSAVLQRRAGGRG